MPDLFLNVVRSFWGTLCEMSPYLLFGFFAAGVLSVVVSARLVERHLGGHGFWPVFKAALFGVPLPLCSCSVIPVTASLRKHGASRGAATAFLISTPQTGVDSIFVTLSLLGPVFAIFRPLVALVSGIIGGAAVDLLEPHGEKDTHALDACEDACCSDNGGNRATRVLTYGFIELPRDIGKPLLLGVIVAGIIAAAIPNDFFAESLGTGMGAILVLMLLGVPVYVCATASVPVALALLLKGASPGAVLAFLMTGPATNAAGIATVWKIMGARTATVYLVTVMATAFGAGVLLDYVFAVTSHVAGKGVGWMLPEPVGVACAGALLAVLFLSFLPRGNGGHTHDHAAPETGDGGCCHTEECSDELAHPASAMGENQCCESGGEEEGGHACH